MQVLSKQDTSFIVDITEKLKFKLRNRRVPNGTHGGVRGQVGN